jgi:hypothetical protein
MTEQLPTVIVYGNCQAGCIAGFLRKTPAFRDSKLIPRVKGVHELSSAELPQVYAAVRGADLLLTQPVSSNYRGVGFSSDHLISLLGPFARTIYYPSLYFGGYFPNLLYLRKPGGGLFTGPGGDYHDRNILDCFIARRTVQSSIAFLADENCYDKSVLRRNTEATLDELRWRESTMEIKIADYIADNLRDRRLFYVFNHPINEVMFQVCSQFSGLIGCRFSGVDLASVDNWLSAVAFPVHPAVHQALGLRFSYTGRFNASGKRDLPMADALELFFDYYNRTPEAVAVYQAAVMSS